jgi:hypothetical protein
MVQKKHLLTFVLTTLTLTVVLFSVLPIRSGGVSKYDPWLDTDDNGRINMGDVVNVLDAFGSTGTPLEKAAILYDSGWLNITDKAGQYFNITHNLNTADLIVDITGRTTLDGGVHQKYFGGTDFVAGWNKTYGGTDSMDWAGVGSGGLIQTADGGYALLDLECVVGSGYQGNVSLRKTDSRGNVQWSKAFGEAGDRFYGSSFPLVQTTDGGYAFAFTKQRAGAWDFWLVRTDAFGTPLWNQSYGGAGDEYVYSMIQTREGGFALIGDTQFGGTEKGYFVLTDSAGNMLWSKVYGVNGECLMDIVQTADGYGMVGFTYAYAVGDRDMWLVKTNASGDMQWYKTYGTEAGETCYALIQTFDGGYALAGDTTSFGAGDVDFWLIKTDSLGNHLWDKTYGGISHEILHDLVQTSDGGYALLGYTSSFGAGGIDFWLVKTDASGNMQWDRTYGGVHDDYAWVLVQTSDGGYAMAGWTNSYGGGSDDAWLIKTDAAGNAVDGFKYGLAWVGSTLNTIDLYRGTDDEYWNYVRIQIWAPR